MSRPRLLHEESTCLAASSQSLMVTVPSIKNGEALRGLIELIGIVE